MAQALTSSLQIGTSSVFLASRSSSFAGAQSIPSVASLPRVVAKADNAKKAAAAVITAAPIALPAAAGAVEVEDVTSFLNQVETFSKQASDVAVQTYETAKDLTDKFVEAAKPVYDAATPVVKSAAQSALEAATPVAKDVAAQATKALSDNGVEIAPVVEAAKTAVSVASGVTSDAFDVASPYAVTSFEQLIAQDPTILAIGAGALLLLYISAPGLAGSVAYAARGFAGEFTAAQTLDLLTQEDYTLIDVRTEQQKSRTGLLGLPRVARGKIAFVPVEEVASKLRGQLRNPRQVEAELAAIKISALKRLNKASRIVVIDSNGDSAKSVAKSLSALGYKNTWVVKDGVDGRSGWVQSQLAVEGYSGGFAEILSPSRIVSAAKRSTGTVPLPRRGFLLSSGSDE